MRGNMIHVENKKFFPYYPEAPTHIYIGRPSVLGNPYRIGVNGTREEVIEKYTTWFRYQLEYNHHVVSEIRRLREVHLEYPNLYLICWCAPLACHGHVIASVLDGMAAGQAIDDWLSSFVN